VKTDTEEFASLKAAISKEKKMVAEISTLGNYMKNAEIGEQRIIDAQIDMIQQTLRKTNNEIPAIVERIIVRPQLIIPGKITSPANVLMNPPQETAPLKSMTIKEMDLNEPSESVRRTYTLKDLKPVGLERTTLKRMRKKEKKVEEVKETKPSEYVKFANRLFSGLADSMLNERTREEMERDLIKANLRFTPRSYLSSIFLTTCVTFIAGILIGIFTFFFSITPELPILIKNAGAIGTRFAISLAIIFLTPIATFIIMYFYPGMEKTSTGNRIESELPFATIHMSAISGSMIDPSKIFNIIITTHEYPFLEKEFKKLINEINVYGLDLVNSLRNSAYNTPSKKLSELLNGLATTINSGGDLPAFFDKRSQTLLFENRLEQEKKNKGAETFMDIYISLVIAAPMILMILLMMMKISGLGISMSTKMITVIMVLAVSMINAVFLVFLQLKK
jgi:hypothetical protein